MKLLTMVNSKTEEHIFVLCPSTTAASRRANRILKANGGDLLEFWSIDLHEATREELEREGWQKYEEVK